MRSPRYKEEMESEPERIKSQKGIDKIVWTLEHTYK